MRTFGGKSRVNKWENLANRKKENEQSSSAQKTFDENATYIMSVHQPDNYAGADIVFNPDIFPNIKLYDKLLISDFEDNQIIIQVQKESFANELKTKNFHLSICKMIAENYDLSLDISNKMNVKLKIVEDVKNFELENIEITFKDQVIYRRDLFKLEKKLVGTCLYSSKIISYEGVKGKVMHLISKSGDAIHSGIVTERTKFVFRTLSSRYYILIEISKEMCECNINGELYLEKAMKTIKALMQRMDVLHTHHKLVFILSARLFYPQFKSLEDAQNYIKNLVANKEEEMNRLSVNCTTFQVDTRGKIFQDIYHRVNTREVKRDWENIISRVKETIFTFLHYINWNINQNSSLKNLINTTHIIDTEKPVKPQNPLGNSLNIAGQMEKNGTFPKVTLPESGNLEVPHIDECSPHLRSRSSSVPQMLLNEIDSDVDLNEAPKKDDKNFTLPVEGELASSEYSNILEALNLALSLYNHHQLSRTLTTTGHTVAVLTAGEGKYFVDSNMARITKECMVLGRVYCNIITLREDTPYNQPLFVYQKNPENYYADLNNEEVKALLDFDVLVAEQQSQMVSNDSMESFATFSLSEQTDEKDGFPYFKNYVGLSHLKDVAMPRSMSQQLSLKMKKRIELDDFLCTEMNNSNRDYFATNETEDAAGTLSKPIYWLNLIKGFTSETLNSHSLIFSFPKTNPDPFLSLSYRTDKIYQPSFQIQQLIKDLPSSTPTAKKYKNKVSEADKFLNSLIRPNTSIFQGEASSFNKDTLISKMNNFDNSLFDEKEVDINAYCIQEAPHVTDLQIDSDRSSGRSPDSFSNLQNITSPLSSGVRTMIGGGPSIEKKNSMVGQQPAIFANIKDRRENSTILKSFSDQLDLSRKLYSHYRVRWARLENPNLNAVVKANSLKNKKAMEISQNILDFEQTWKNLAVPPLLPLQTYFFPSEAELLDDKKYQKLQYYFNLTGDIKQKIDDFMDELVSQRLTLDFQLVDGDSLDSFGKSSAFMHFKQYFRLSWGTVHHKIYLNLIDNLMFNIYIKKKERRVGNNTFNVDFFPTYYRYLLFNDKGKGLVRKSIILGGIKQIKWNKFDLFVSNSIKLDEEFERESLENFRVKAISLIMIPLYKNGQRSTRETVVANFKKVIDTLQDKLSEYGSRKILNPEVLKKRKDLRAMSEKVSLLTKEEKEVKKSSEITDMTEIMKIFIGGQASGFNHFYFEYDNFFCPKAGFHFKLHWFSCSGSIIADLIRSMNALLRNADFTLKFIPNLYQILHAHPFESNLRINCSANIMHSLRKYVQQPPFNFILNSFHFKKFGAAFTSFMHETGSIILYFYDDFIVWKDNRLVDTNINAPGDSDMTALSERLFRNLIASIHCLEIIHETLNKCDFMLK